MLALFPDDLWLETLHFSVAGVPKPKGSARAYTYKRKAAQGGGLGARVELDDKKSRTWQKLVAWEAKAACVNQNQIIRPVRPLWPTAAGWPMAIALEFCLPAPERIPIVRRGMPTTTPDCDKLARLILDALTGVVWKDDAQVVWLMAKKRYVTGAAAACVHVIVAEPRGPGTPVLPDLPLEPEPCSAATPCCDRRNEYNGYATGRPLLFTCPQHCGCHD